MNLNSERAKVELSPWCPTSGVTRHSGKPIPPDASFFAPPPPEIGNIISADSTLKVSSRSKPRMPHQLRFLLALLGGLATFLVGVLIIVLPSITTFNPATELAMKLVWTLILLMWCLFILAMTAFVYYSIYSKTGFEHICSYVGSNGIAEFNLKGSRNGKLKSKLLLFADAKDLFTIQTRTYYGGHYSYTTYFYSWDLNAHKTLPSLGESFLLFLGGSYKSEQNCPEDGSTWYFANASEIAWSNYHWSNLNLQLNAQGYVEFTMRRSSIIESNPLTTVRIRYGILEYVFKDGLTQHVAVSDMTKVSIKNGVFQFIHKDASRRSGQGKFSFSYGNLSNAKLFLAFLKQVAGISWT
jgi:hypothetical protein